MNTTERYSGPEADPLRYRVDDPATGVSGGQGIVYLAWTDGPDGKPERVALKLLSEPSLDVPRMLAMTERLCRIDDPHLVRQREVFLGTGLCASDAIRGDGGAPFDVWYSVSDWVDGRDLDEAIKDVNVSIALNWVADVAQALAHLHQVDDGVIHRDIKPSNVRITPSGTAVVIDYGSARTLTGATMTQGVGTPGWQAPEVLFDPSQVGLAADAWGVAALAHWVVTGMPPTLASRDAHIERLRKGAARTGIAHPDEFARLVGPFLDTEPDERGSASAHELLEWSRRLRSLARGVGKRSHRSAVVVAASVAVLVAVALGLYLTSRSPKDLEASPIAQAAFRLGSTPYSDGAKVTDVWIPPRTGRDLRGTVTIENTTDKELIHAQDVVIPKSLAPTLGVVRFSRVPDSIVDPDPIARYCLKIPPHAREILRYRVDSGTSDINTATLRRWANEWQQSAMQNLATDRGKRCEGAPAVPPTATIRAPIAGTAPVKPARTPSKQVPSRQSTDRSAAASSPGRDATSRPPATPTPPKPPDTPPVTPVSSRPALSIDLKIAQVYPNGVDYTYDLSAELPDMQCKEDVPALQNVNRAEFHPCYFPHTWGSYAFPDAPGQALTLVINVKSGQNTYTASLPFTTPTS